jgi:predicted naringenin-chalcone synthase
MTVFKEAMKKLGIKAARNAIEDWGGDPKDISHIYTTCTSGWEEPGLAVAAMEALGIPYSCQKAELNFNGCFCGATCIRLARDALVANDGKPVLVIAVEIPTLHYDPLTEDVDDLVTHAIFRDGAGAVVLASEGQWKYKKTGAAVVPNTAERMTFYPPHQPDQVAYRMHLDKDVGAALNNYFTGDHGARILKEVYPDTSKTPPILAIHPGGIRILEGMGGVLFPYGWPEDGLDDSYEILRSFGNVGAAAMLIVLDKKLKAFREEGPRGSNKEKRELVTMTFGPGVTVEWALLEEVV